MSLISDALAKAQAEKDRHYQQFEKILQCGPSTGRRRLPYTRIVVTAVFAVVVAAGSLFWMIEVGRGKQQAASAVPAKSAAPSATAAWTPSVEATRIYMDALNHQRNGEYAIAEVLYRQVIAMEPNHPYALNNLGVLQMLQKMPDRAVQFFQQAIALKKDYAHPHYNLACIYAQQNRVEASLQSLQQALILKPDMQAWAKKDKDLQILWEQPEFKKLMEKAI
jgi:tetratricopeptide (TPR) repeat protein